MAETMPQMFPSGTALRATLAYEVYEFRRPAGGECLKMRPTRMRAGSRDDQIEICALRPEGLRFARGTIAGRRGSYVGTSCPHADRCLQGDSLISRRRERDDALLTGTSSSPRRARCRGPEPSKKRASRRGNDGRLILREEDRICPLVRCFGGFTVYTPRCVG